MCGLTGVVCFGGNKKRARCKEVKRDAASEKLKSKVFCAKML
jgi:hypothetical protein